MRSLFWICLFVLFLCSSYYIQASAVSNLGAITSYSGGAKRPGIKKMFSAFWLSLIDPSNVEGLKNEQKKEKVNITGQKKSTFFGSKSKGKSLK